MEIEVAVDAPVPRTFSYLSDQDLSPGTRVLVPFGRQTLMGVVIGPAEASPKRAFALKPVKDIVDSDPIYSPIMLRLAQWLSDYYMHPLGEVLRTMLPVGSQKQSDHVVELSAVGRQLMEAGVDPRSSWLAALFSRKDRLKRSSAGAKLRKLKSEYPEAEVPSLASLQRENLVTTTRLQTRIKARLSQDSRPISKMPVSNMGEQTPRSPSGPPVLTEDQIHAIRCAKDLVLDGDLKPLLLHGVTGSGKTEVYLQLIDDLLAKQPSSQTLIMVPEISLTPQMTKVFSDRFPGQVAVVHSGMSDDERWTQLQRVHRGAAKILIGPRSAVFAPFQALKLVVVDEEHDSSYKQTTGLTYNGRDVAVLRGQWEGALVILGSGTPSTESYHNALRGKYKLASMPRRVGGQKPPSIEIIERSSNAMRIGERIDSKPGAPEDDLSIEPQLVDALRQNLDAGQQSMVIVNRRGYAFYLFSMEQREAVSCPRCSISLTLHNYRTQLRCHYCDYATMVSRVQADRPGETLVAVGYGSQKAETHLQGLFPKARIVRLDADTAARRDFLATTLEKFRAREIDVLVGTQILAKGHDYPGVTLTAILDVDQQLHLPDFRAGERTFQLIVQAAGRAGRGQEPGRVLMQTSRADHPVVKAASNLDYDAFVSREIAFRQDHGYPPFCRMLAIEMSHPDSRTIHQFAERVRAWLGQISDLQPDLISGLRVLGPATPPMEQIRGRYRQTLLVSSLDPRQLHKFGAAFRLVFTEKQKADLRVRFDIDPQSLL